MRVTTAIGADHGTQIMTDEKKLKREIKKTWDALKDERRARSKMHGAAELAESAQRVAGHAADLKDLARRMEGIESAALMATPAARAKTKGKLKAQSKARSAKAKRQPETRSDVAEINGGEA
jgi:hypothetical protein